jgi:putative Mg2+ transporter-C (MgtC) family protein
MLTTPVSWVDVALRIAAALVAGFLIGIERESRGRAAGLRTTILVCVAADVAMIVAFLFFAEATTGKSPSTLGWAPDPTRVAQGILTGMGFLGAGTIIRHGDVVHGLTTAAALWFITIIGIAFGSGYYVPGAIGLAAALFVLFILQRFERLVTNERYVTVTVTAQMDGADATAIRRQIEADRAKVIRMDLSFDMQAKKKTFQCGARFRQPDEVAYAQAVVAHLLQQPGVLEVKWDQQN